MATGLNRKRSRRNTLTVVFAVLLLTIGGYALISALYPFMTAPLINSESNQTTNKLSETENKIGKNYLYIPKININLPYEPGSEDVMLSGAWWRSPTSGNPEAGGNFILSGHRFTMSWTPGDTLRRSPFYNIDKLEPGDSIVVDYNGKRYSYNVTSKFTAPPTATEIEAPTNDDRLTLYSCGLGGAADVREVIVAKKS